VASLPQGYDLEDVNFAFDKTGVIDAVPQLARLADMLSAHPDVLLTIKGHADWRGPGAYNERLSLDRATMVRDALVRKGISGDRISVMGFGEMLPAADNKTREGRWVNRRVVFDVYRMVDGVADYYYRDNKFIKGFEGETPIVIGPDIRMTGAETETPAGQDNGEILDRLGRIEKNLDELRADLKAPAQPELETAPVPPVMPRLFPGDVRGLLAGSLGSDTDGHLTGRVEGRIFWPFNDSVALQGGATGLLAKSRDEYRFDLGLVGRFDAFQGGFFVQGLAADLDGADETGVLSQIAVTLGYITPYGVISAYGTHPIEKEDVVRVDQRFIGADLETTETYIRARKTYGIAADLSFCNRWYMEGSLGYISAADDVDISGHLQVGYLLGTGNLSVFLRGEMNNGQLVDDNDGRLLAGLEWGTWRTREYESGEKVSPMVVPALHYEVKVRTSMLYSDVNLAPQVSINVSSVSGEVPLTVEFQGSAHDPDGEVAAFHWNFADGGSAEGADASHTFQAAGVYRVVLTATDNKGVTGQADVVITVIDKADINTNPVADAGRDQVLVFEPDLDGVVCIDHPYFCEIIGLVPDVNIVQLDGSLSTDLDGDVLTYRWEQLSGPPIILEGADTPTPSFVNPFNQDGTYVFRLIVTDGRGGLDDERVTISVRFFWGRE